MLAWILVVTVFAVDLALLSTLPLSELYGEPFYDPETHMYIEPGFKLYWYTPILSAVFNVALWCIVALALTSAAYILVATIKNRKQQTRE